MGTVASVGGPLLWFCVFPSPFPSLADRYFDLSQQAELSGPVSHQQPGLEHMLVATTLPEVCLNSVIPQLSDDRKL